MSRKTGYKWLERYDTLGVAGLVDQPRVAEAHPRWLTDAAVDAIIEARKDHPHWGPKKLPVLLCKSRPELARVGVSTIAGVLERFGLVRARRRRPSVPRYSEPLDACVSPNDVWCADFKGHFALRDGRRCYPLTISDAASRFLIKCEGLHDPDEERVRPHFERAFFEFGLPLKMRTDNGPPFASKALGGLPSRPARDPAAHPPWLARQRSGRHRRRDPRAPLASTRALGTEVAEARRMRVLALLSPWPFSRRLASLHGRALPGCEARSTPSATRRSRITWRLARWLGALGVVLAVGIVLALTRSACADERAPDGHAYSLGECLSLTERNHPSLSAARARLGAMRGQVEEAAAARAPLVALNSRFGVVPNTPAATGAPATTSSNFLSQSLSNGVGPFVQLGLTATLPLYTFGKIASANRAAEAQVRVGEWDVEKERQQVRIDVRRAFYGVTVARDLLALAADALAKLDDAIGTVRRKLAAGERGVDEVDRIRLEVSRDDILARMGEAKRGEVAGLAALRFYTGVQTGFDVPDVPLTRPATPLGPVVSYLTAARTHRPDVNRARAGVAARSAQVDWAHANLLPDLGLGMQFDWTAAPGVTGPVAGVDTTSLNSPQFGATFGLQWSLDLLTKNARVHQAQSNLEEARALERLALGGVATEVEGAYAAAVEASAREETWARAVHRAKGWVVAVRDAIDLGTKDESALVEPLRTMLLARANQLQALVDTNMTRAELARLTGWENAAPPS